MRNGKAEVPQTKLPAIPHDMPNNAAAEMPDTRLRSILLMSECLFTGVSENLQQAGTAHDTPSPERL